MEQQSISISKAGIVTSLHARCSVIAAANPIGGVYKSNMNFNDNVELTDPILSRFDILTVIKDEAFSEVDDALATFVLNSHMKSHPRIRQLEKDTVSEEDRLETTEFLQKNLLDESNIKQTDPNFQIDQELLKKYIIYAKRNVQPKLNEIDKEKVTQFYADIRRESNIVGGIPIAVRHIESVIRMSEAHAKIHLRDFVKTDDIDFAIRMMVESFLQSQKETVKRNLRKKLGKYLQSDEDNTQAIHFKLVQMGNQAIALEKANRGIEEPTRITIRIKESVFYSEFSYYDAKSLQTYLNSNTFKKEFKHDE